jgi:photosystem I P700 chlorophyll a apoprotein A1
MAAAMFLLVGSTTTKCKLEWFQNVESMLNHHLAGLLGLGSLAWAGHQFTFLYLLISYYAGVDPKEIPLPHEFY